MERNTKTTFYQLQHGDRFYKTNDRKKEVFEKVAGCYSLLGAIADNEKVSEYQKAGASKVTLGNTEVIFLRNKNNQIQ